ncbi:hypothetical protein A2899_02800 [Candidatus Amesbacteria bacterium RIFCSPLOWO2_01_FULL_49_25]|nr:MAG: hypothetical protein A2899_02800 [Candidatus Amesbacteria bacterium RIFCSPLOWO2_01_FULL_49_25]
MDPDIEFKFQGIGYTVSSEALELKRIVLPDRRILKFQYWFEFDDRPPQIFGLHEVPFLNTVDLSSEQIAQQVNGALASQIPTKEGEENF